MACEAHFVPHCAEMGTLWMQKRRQTLSKTASRIWSMRNLTYLSCSSTPSSLIAPSFPVIRLFTTISQTLHCYLLVHNSSLFLSSCFWKIKRSKFFHFANLKGGKLDFLALVSLPTERENRYFLSCHILIRGDLNNAFAPKFEVGCFRIGLFYDWYGLETGRERKNKILTQFSGVKIAVVLLTQRSPHSFARDERVEIDMGLGQIWNCRWAKNNPGWLLITLKVVTVYFAAERVVRTSTSVVESASARNHCLLLTFTESWTAQSAQRPSFTAIFSTPVLRTYLTRFLFLSCCLGAEGL